jgi:hypothetical protein
VRAQAETVAVVPFCVVDNIRFLYRTAIPARGFFGGRPGATGTLLIKRSAKDFRVRRQTHGRRCCSAGSDYGGARAPEVSPHPLQNLRFGR